MQLIAFQFSYKLCKCNLEKRSNIYSFYDPAIRLRSRCRARGNAACQRLSVGVRILTATTSTAKRLFPHRMWAGVVPLLYCTTSFLAYQTTVTLCPLICVHLLRRQKRKMYRKEEEASIIGLSGRRMLQVTYDR